MTHDELNELYELYALGVLEEPAAAEIDRHLAEGCEYCKEHVQTAFWTTASLAGMAKEERAPRALRKRVINAVVPVKTPRRWVFAISGVSVVALGLLGLALWSVTQNQTLHSTIGALASQRDDFEGQVQKLTNERNRLLNQDQQLHSTIDTLTRERNNLRGRAQSLSSERTRLTSQAGNLQSRIEALTAERNGLRTRLQTVESERNQLLSQQAELRSIVDVVANAGTRTLQFGQANNVPHGRVFLPPSGGVMFVGLQLPQLPPDRTFQLWLVPSQGVPRSAGVFRANASGQAVYSSQTPRSGLNTAAVAVSVEPNGGSPAPTTKPIIVVPLKS